MNTSPNTKKTLTLTPGLAAALEAYAQRYNLNESQLLRQSIAHEIGYDLSQDPATIRPGRYATPTAAQAAKSAQNTTRNRTLSAIRRALRDAESSRILDSLLK